MAASFASFIALLLAANAVAQEAVPRADRELPINIDAASSEVDYRSNTVVFRDVTITQGTVSVAATMARATGLDFRDSTWTFTGDVRIRTAGGKLTSDEARVQFRNNVLAFATITGSPARFEQQLAEPRGTATGHAGVIEYDMTTGSVKFSRDAWLSDGRNEISGPELVYNVTEQRVVAESDPSAGSRVRITIQPEMAPTPAPAPTPPPSDEAR
jgi:lipopolysaccharide transport protein LptA